MQITLQVGFDANKNQYKDVTLLLIKLLLIKLLLIKW
tara:strand:- start:71 stop:181 length:111 start_codon:yes stop_codon:yes gene_type:complete